jgi:Family of unknown function (DUF6069)
VRVGSVGIISATVAAAADALIYTVARALGVSMFMPYEPGHAAAVLPLSTLITEIILGALAGTIVFALLGFIARQRWFPIVGIVFLVITLAGPLGLSITGTADGATVATLILMHIIAGGSIIALLNSQGRQHSKLRSGGAA